MFGGGGRIEWVPAAIHQCGLRPVLSSGGHYTWHFLLSFSKRSQRPVDINLEDKCKAFIEDNAMALSICPVFKPIVPNIQVSINTEVLSQTGFRRRQPN
jgi:hypothetical protein